MGRSFIKTFENDDAAQEYAEVFDAIVYNFDEMFNEVNRMRQWMRQSYDEYCTAKRRLESAREMFVKLAEAEGLEL